MQKYFSEDCKILQDFEFQKVLNCDVKAKSIIFLGFLNSNNEAIAILILRKSEFLTSLEHEMKNLIQGVKYLQNDIYKKFTLQFGLSQYNEIDCELIYPADQSHIDKIITESKNDFLQKVQPHILKQSTPERLQWIYNILEKKAEIENILYEEDGEDGFVLIRDYSFKPESNINNLHLLALTYNRKLNSLRDLNIDHVEMLKKIYIKGVKLKSYNQTQMIQDKFDIPVYQIKVFIHYLPSFYHFHVHFKHIEIQGEAFRDHLLLGVIQNIEISHKYYQNVDLQYMISNKLFDNIF